MRFLLGVDEAGRGPLAGPVSVGVVAVPEGFDVLKEFPGVADSKKLSEKKREKIFEMLTTRASAGDVCFAVEFESAETIDREGIAVAVRRALARGVNTLAPDAALVKIQLDGASAPLETSRLGTTGTNPGASLTGQARPIDSVHILLDGSLRAPPQYSQETIINGDELIPIVSLASIAAKVVRDRLMVGLSAEYPQYGFEKHKGYGTRAHYEMLEKHGLCVIHRRSFIHLDSKGK